MDVIVRSNNNPVNDMTAPVSWLINDFYDFYVIYILIETALVLEQILEALQK